MCVSHTAPNIMLDTEFIPQLPSSVCLSVWCLPPVWTLMFVFYCSYVWNEMQWSFTSSYFFPGQRAPPHQIGDAALPRSDPNLSAPDKGRPRRLTPVCSFPDSHNTTHWIHRGGKEILKVLRAAWFHMFLCFITEFSWCSSACFDYPKNVWKVSVRHVFSPVFTARRQVLALC